MGGIVYLSATRCSRALSTASFMVLRKVGWPTSRQASGESESMLWLVSILMVSSCS
jgi:preprotein translocase subunit SecE